MKYLLLIFIISLSTLSFADEITMDIEHASTPQIETINLLAYNETFTGPLEHLFSPMEPDECVWGAWCQTKRDCGMASLCQNNQCVCL